MFEIMKWKGPLECCCDVRLFCIFCISYTEMRWLAAPALHDCNRHHTESQTYHKRITNAQFSQWHTHNTVGWQSLLTAVLLLSFTYGDAQRSELTVTEMLARQKIM